MPIDKTFEFRFSEKNERSVRESVATLVRTIPIDVTLTTSGTAEDFISLESNDEPAYNMVTNPSFETASPPTSWTAVSSTLSRVGSGTVTPRTDTYSLQVVAGNATAREGAYYEETGVPIGWYALSVYVQRTGGGTAQIRASSDGGTSFTSSAAVTMDGTWQRLSVKHRVRNAETTLRLYVVTNTQQNITYWAEDAQIEPHWGVIEGTKTGREDNPPQAGLTTFITPTGNRYSRWLGTANASASVREPTISTIHEIHIEAVNANFYIDFDRTAQDSSGNATSILLRAGDTMNGRKIVKNNISFVNEVTGQLPRVLGYVLGT